MIVVICATVLSGLGCDEFRQAHITECSDNNVEPPDLRWVRFRTEGAKPHPSRLSPGFAATGGTVKFHRMTCAPNGKRFGPAGPKKGSRDRSIKWRALHHGGHETRCRRRPGQVYGLVHNKHNACCSVNNSLEEAYV